MHVNSKWFGKSLFVVWLLICTSLMADDSSKLAPGDHRRSLTVDGRERDYHIHVPPGCDGIKPVPVVLAFHGGLSNAAQMAHFCGLNDKADQAGFIVVYPNGTGRVEGAYTWNAGYCCGYAQRLNVDDVGFVRAVLDDLPNVVHVDPLRIYATGMSNGGLMSYRLAAELSDRIAAIASVSGPMGLETVEPQRPVPVLHFHGTDDKFTPFEGGIGERSLSQVKFLSAQQSIDLWIKANGCPATPVVTCLELKVDDGMKVTRSVYGPGREGAEVVFYRIDGAGHTWPGRKPNILFLGKATQNISANDLIWEFFEKHPRQAKPQ